MTVHNRESAEITQLDPTLTNPLTMPNSLNYGALMKTAKGLIVAGATDEVASIYRFIRVPSNARLESLRIYGDGTTSGAADVGLYYAIGHAKVSKDIATVGGTGSQATEVGSGAADGGGTVISAAFFASAIAFPTAAALSADAGTDCLDESTTNTTTKQLQPLWQAVGLARDPGGYFDICATITTVLAAGTQYILRATYTA